jgi:hypothetical protein
VLGTLLGSGETKEGRVRAQSDPGLVGRQTRELAFRGQERALSCRLAGRGVVSSLGK